MMPSPQPDPPHAAPQALPHWFPYLDLGCAGLACSLWYALPWIGPWPLILALAPWAVRLIQTGQATQRTPFNLPLVIFLLIAALGVWTAFDRDAARSKFWLIAGGLLLFYAFANAAPLGGIRVWILAAFGAGVALYFIVTHDWDAYPAKIAALTNLGRSLQSPLPPLPGHRLHPNVAGGIMAMMVPYASLAAVWSGRQVKAQTGSAASWLALASALVLLLWTCFGLLMSTSRGAWLGLAAALLLAALWALARLVRARTSLSQTWAFLGLVSAFLIVAFVLVLAWPGGPAGLLAKIPGPDTATSRLDLLRQTLTLAGDYPLLGAGLGSYMMLHSTYAMLMHVGFTVHSHNLFLNVAIELGFFALLALVWIWILFGSTLLRAAGRAEVEPGMRVGTESLGAAALSLVVLIVHGLADDVLFGSRGVILLFVPLAFAVPFAPGANRTIRDRGRRWAAVILPLALIGILAVALLWREPVISRINSNLGAVLQSRSELGTYVWPDWPIQDAVRREIDITKPIGFFERALESDPGNETANRRLGQIALSLGKYEEALHHLEAAHKADSENMTTRQLLGEAYATNGRYDDGAALWSTVSNAHGQLRYRAWWYHHIGMDEVAGWMDQMAAEQ